LLAKREIQSDFDEMYKLLMEYDYKARISDELIKEYLKSIHKASYIFCIWKINFEKVSLDYTYIDEIVSTFIQIIYTTVYRDVKILYMLYRNIIDNFIKVCKDRLSITCKYTLEAFEIILDKDEIKDNRILDDSFRKILNLYKVSCGYVHSQDEKFLSFNEGIKNYNLNNKEDLKRSVKEFYNLIKNINYIFIFLYEEIYDKEFTPEEKQLIHFFCNREDLREIFYIKYGVRYNK